MSRLSRSNLDFPPCSELFLKIATDGSDGSRNDDPTVFDLFRDPTLLNKSTDSVPDELPGSPGGQYGEAFRVHHQEPARNSTRFNFTRDNEVGQREVGGNQDGGLLAGITQRVDSLLHHHGSLGIGINVQSFHKEWKQAFTLEIRKNDDPCIFSHKGRS